MEKKLQVHNLQISFRTVSGKLHAVRDISFDLDKGETLAIVGESGSGKSVTSKAILGILAGNSIVEGGEILYDGQDLLKIPEDDFYRIRGDKIAMIFQDPLSSLNPIMRIGKQLTEAMLLKGKARQRSSKKNFNDKLNLLEKYMEESNPNKTEEIKSQCALFRRFEMRHIKLEQAYNAALESANEALIEIENILFLIEKNAFKDPAMRLKEVREFSLKAINPYVVSADSESILKSSAESLPSGLRSQIKLNNFSVTVQRLTTIHDILSEAIAKSKPDFFAMGYCLEAGYNIDIPGTIAEKNAKFDAYMNEHFLNGFIALAERAVVDSDAKYLKKREALVGELDTALLKLSAENADDNVLRALPNDLCDKTRDTIDQLDIVKDSIACTFPGSLKGFVDDYFRGKRTNGGKMRKYERQMARYNKIIEKGKTPDYKVADPTVVNLELVKENITRMIANLKAHYETQNAADAQEDRHEKTERLIDYIKDNASGMVYHVNKRAAKNKALKLMEEVGIDDPRRRYRQYPFEFSGGMRQRIVIAIALAANPDILICDEPTTALDVTIQAQILELINKLKRERNLSIIFITHDLGVVANMADRIAVMYAGKIVEYGTAEEVFYAPAHPYTWALLSSMPDLETKEKLEAIPGTPPIMLYPPKGDAFAERNRYAMKIDFERQPPEFKISDTHWASTWLLHPDAPKIDPPKAVTDRIAKMRARVGGEANA